MRPLQQADPNVQMMLVDRGNGRGIRDRDRAGAPRGTRRPSMGAALADLTFRKLFLLSQVARTDIERNRARTA